MLDLFQNSLRIRLPQFQRRYNLGFKILLLSLIFSIIVLIGHQLLFSLSQNPRIYFAKKVYVPYLLAKELKSKNIYCYETTNIRERDQLKYYDILPCVK